MKGLKYLFFFFFLFFISVGYTIKRLDYRDGRFKNVCKDLRGEALLYFIFVDTKETSPWTEFDIKSTIDSINLAVRWIHEKAKENNIPLNIKTDYHIGQEYTTVRKNLPYGTVQQTVREPSFKKGLAEMNKWADGIARVAGNSLHITGKDGIPEIKNPRNKERLVAFLRDAYDVESVALMYFVNNYFRDDISITVNTMDTEDVEFAVISYKYPSEIAHSFLNLFGAADMYKTPYRRHDKKIEFLKNEFPKDIMQDPYSESIWEMNMSIYTKYLIGWEKELPEEYEFLLTDKIVNF
ncbi:MAG: hypothetical protein ACLFUC_08745 [Bacteroidales bacterium]